jgi:hypothetical protein
VIEVDDAILGVGGVVVGDVVGDGDGVEKSLT